MQRLNTFKNYALLCAKMIREIFLFWNTSRLARWNDKWWRKEKLTFDNAKSSIINILKTDPRNVDLSYSKKSPTFKQKKAYVRSLASNWVHQLHQIKMTILILFTELQKSFEIWHLLVSIKIVEDWSLFTFDVTKICGRISANFDYLMRNFEWFLIDEGG